MMRLPGCCTVPVRSRRISATHTNFGLTRCSRQHVRKHCLEASHPSLLELSRSKLHRILTQGEIRPHKIRYYVERRDPEFERKMIEVLHVYKEVEIVNAGLVEGTLKEPPVQSRSPTMRNPAFRHWRRLRRTGHLRRISSPVICGITSTNGWGQYRYWLAWICIPAELRRSSVIATPARTSSPCWENSMPSYPAQTRIRLLLDNHSAHISKETQALA